MNKIAFILGSAFFALSLHAVRLQDYPNFDYEVLFTNPTCATYYYDEPVKSNAGKLIEHKPVGAYCDYKDSRATSKRVDPPSPQTRLIEWIEDPSTTEVFFTYLSWSNSAVTRALCKARKERNIKITAVIDSGYVGNEKAAEVEACVPDLEEDEIRPFTIHYRGHTGTGQDEIKYAHNKLFMINPNSKTVGKMAFSSGNMSSGVILHHENWHFVTVDTNSYFFQSHLCLRDGVIDHGQRATQYADFIQQCRRGLVDKGLEPESDIQHFFVPGEGWQAGAVIADSLKWSKNIGVAAHRFSFWRLQNGLKNALKYGSNVRIIVDDDLYYLKDGAQLGDNMEFEFYNLQSRIEEGAKVRYLETNSDRHLLHHNKYLVLDNSKTGNNSGVSNPDIWQFKPTYLDTPAVFAGAGNFTTSAFQSNFENFYYIQIPSVIRAFDKQYNYMFDELATSHRNMPAGSYRSGFSEDE